MRLLFVVTLFFGGATSAQEVFNAPTGRYIVCVEQLILDGAVGFYEDNNSPAEASRLVSAAVTLCSKEKRAAILSIMDLTGSNDKGLINKTLDEELVPKFLKSAKRVNRTLKKVHR